MDIGQLVGCLFIQVIHKKNINAWNIGLNENIEVIWGLIIVAEWGSDCEI